MPLFGSKKGADGGKSGKSGSSSSSKEAKSTPTVEDKYTMKDVLGT
jgi:hypothetical protein